MTVKKRIFVNGSFDILHVGHLRLLNYARSLGDYLLVAIDTDRRIKELKGSDRPINNIYERKTMLQNLKAVNEVQIFDSDIDLRNILEAYKPNVIVKGSDHQHTSKLSHEHCEEVIFYERFGNYSTTKKILNITAR